MPPSRIVIVIRQCRARRPRPASVRAPHGHADVQVQVERARARVGRQADGRLRGRGRSRTCAAAAPGRCRGPGTRPATAIWSIQPSPGILPQHGGADQLVAGDGDDAHPRLPARRGDRRSRPSPRRRPRSTALPVRERVVDQVEHRALLARLQQPERDAGAAGRQARAARRRAGSCRIHEVWRDGAAEALQQLDCGRIVVADGLAGELDAVLGGARRPPLDERRADAAAAVATGARSPRRGRGTSRPRPPPVAVEHDARRRRPGRPSGVPMTRRPPRPRSPRRRGPRSRRR